MSYAPATPMHLCQAKNVACSMCSDTRLSGVLFQAWTDEAGVAGKELSPMKAASLGVSQHLPPSRKTSPARAVSMLEAIHLHADCHGLASSRLLQLTSTEPPVISLRCPVAVRPHSPTPVTTQLIGAISSDQLRVQVCL